MRGRLLVLAAGGVSLWLLRSVLADVYGEVDQVWQVDPRWLVAIGSAEAVAFTATWQLNRIALRTTAWFDVAVAQLAGNAATNVLPAGAPAGAAVQLRVLREAGFDLTTAATSLGALSILGAAGLLAAPAIALPFAIVDRHEQGLRPVLLLGALLLLVVLGLGALFLWTDRSLAAVARGVHRLQLRLWPSRAGDGDLAERVLMERDEIRVELAERPGAVLLATILRPAGDCLAVYLCLLAVGARPSPLAVLAAFAAANVAGMVPLTPGGLGFVEVGLTATLVAMGVDAQQAVLAVALYRVASTWLPVLLGGGAYGVFRWRHRTVRAGGDEGGAVRRRRHLLVVTAVTVVGFALVAPILVRVYRRAPDALSLGPGWTAAILVAIAAHFIAAWALYRVVLRTSDWFDIGTSQLASNAVSHVAPVGSAVGAGLQLRMLTVAGYPTSQAAAALGATTVLGTVVGYVVLPLAVLLAGAFGSSVEPRLAGAMWTGAALLAVVLAVVVAGFVRDGPWRWAARAVTTMRRWLRRPGDADDLTRRLLEERDAMRATLRQRPGLVAVLALAQPLADYVALYLALRAVGANVPPSAVLAAFIVSNIAGLIPFTPGGLGFVEAGLTGVLVVAGGGGHEVRLAVVTYRLAAVWLPILAGAIAFALFHRRHRSARVQPDGHAPLDLTGDRMTSIERT